MATPLQETLESLRETIERLEFSKVGTLAAGDQVQAAANLRWEAIETNTPTELSGARVLDLGDGTLHEVLAFAARGAAHVLAIQGTDRGASELPPQVELRSSRWDALDPARDGAFDVIHCRELLHRVLEPMALLQKLRRMTADGGVLLISSMLLADPERSDCLRFVPDQHAGDPHCRFVPGRLAFRWLVETAGFEVHAEFGEIEGPRDGFPVVTSYLSARAR